MVLNIIFVVSKGSILSIQIGLTEYNMTIEKNTRAVYQQYKRLSRIEAKKLNQSVNVQNVSHK